MADDLLQGTRVFNPSTCSPEINFCNLSLLLHKQDMTKQVPANMRIGQNYWAILLDFCNFSIALVQHPHLSKEPLASTPSRSWIINVNIVVLSTNWLFYKRLLENFSIHFHMIFSFNQVAFWRNSANNRDVIIQSRNKMIRDLG